jgi:hypothetical protein
MNAKSQKLERALKSLSVTRIEPFGIAREAEQMQQEARIETKLLLPMILASETRRHGIRELKSPLSE